MACFFTAASIAALSGVGIAIGDTVDAPVVIIGGGAAGIAAGQALHAAETKFLLLEAGPALGGRVRQRSLGGFTIEEGANWIHGPETEDGSINPVWVYKKRYDLQGNWTDYLSARFTTRSGDVIDKGLLDKWWVRVEHVMEYCSKRSDELWEQADQQDLSPAESIDQSIQACFDAYGYWQASRSKLEHDVAAAMKWLSVAFETALVANRSSTMWSFPLNDEYIDKDFLVTDQRGYGVFLRGIAEAFEESVKLSHKVTAVEYSETGVVVTCSNGLQVQAEYGICTLPLGVLQHGNVEFSPPFSKERLAGIHGMKMGHYAKVNLGFASNFWGVEKEVIMIAGKPEGFMTWGLNLDHPKYLPGSKMLSFHFAGEMAARFESQPHTLTQTEVMVQLRKLYGPCIPEPNILWISNWTNDPLAYGSYSTWPLGYEGEAWLSMKSDAGRLSFAGEHTADNYGFVHSALDSGTEAAAKILEAIHKQPSTTRRATKPLDTTSTPSTPCDTTQPASSPCSPLGKWEAEESTSSLSGTSIHFTSVSWLGAMAFCMVLVAFAAALSCGRTRPSSIPSSVMELDLMEREEPTGDGAVE